MFSGLPNGFTLDLNVFSKSTHSARILPKVDSTFQLGVLLGAFADSGVVHLSLNNRNSEVGSVRWYVSIDNTRFAAELVYLLERVFELPASYFTRPHKEPNVYTVICHNKNLARFFSDFGKGANRELPSRYLVNNPEYLQGLRYGIVQARINKRDSKNSDKPKIDLLLKHINKYLGGIDAKVE